MKQVWVLESAVDILAAGKMVRASGDDRPLLPPTAVVVMDFRKSQIRLNCASEFRVKDGLDPQELLDAMAAAAGLKVSLLV